MSADYNQLRQLASVLSDLQSNSSAKESFPTLAEKGLHLLLALKTDFKGHCLQAEAAKETTAASKAQLEQANLQLQNLLYERQYYEKEIRGQVCLAGAPLQSCWCSSMRSIPSWPPHYSPT